MATMDGTLYARLQSTTPAVAAAALKELHQQDKEKTMKRSAVSFSDVFEIEKTQAEITKAGRIGIVGDDIGIGKDAKDGDADDDSMTDDERKARGVASTSKFRTSMKSVIFGDNSQIRELPLEEQPSRG